MQVIGISLFLLNQTMAMVYIFFLLYYIATGLNLPVNISIRSRYFGRKAYGSIHGSSMGLLAVVGVVAPIYAGWIYDTTGSYTTAFISFIVAMLVGVVFLFFARRPQPPASAGRVERDLSTA